MGAQGTDTGPAPPPHTSSPRRSEDTFKGVIDLVKMKALVWSGEELGAKFDEASDGQGV